MNPFYEDVYRIVQQIPTGKVASYSQIAWALGKMNGARAVGRAMKSCPAALPAHRVVRADGENCWVYSCRKKTTVTSRRCYF
jgi:methylated-DNA-protein-cysteine methyltransferase-like protein